MQRADLASINFSVISEEDVRSISVLEVTETEIYNENGAIRGGLRDDEMGPTCIGKGDNRCKVCDQSVQNCGGHFGHVEFPLHLYHINRSADVIRTLKRRCMKCYEDLGPVKKKQCPHCNENLPKIDWNSKKCVVTVNGKDTPAHKIVKWLGNDSKLLMKNMLVPPNCVRPPPTVGDEEIMGEDNCTRGLLQIVRSLRGLKNRIKSGDPSAIIDSSAIAIQKHVNLYIDRQRTTKTRGGPSMADRFRGKKGRLRGNTQGKRCNFTARSVVTGDSNLGMREVGVPQSIANNVTKRVIVNTINFQKMNRLLEEGKIKTVYRGQQMYDLQKRKGTTRLLIGDEVDRALQDGDLVLFNRQPSLHRMSIMAHRVKILPWSTFRLNLSCTTPYNADFDGDEMNLHSLQSVEAEAEMLTIMSVDKNFITPSSHRPVMSIVQDTLLALYEISHPDYTFSYSAMMQWFYAAGIEGQPPTEKRKYSGLEVISFSFPSTLNYRRGSFVIRGGKIISGRITKKIMGRSDGSLIHVLVLDYGGAKTCDIIDTLQRGVAQWSYTMGFSIGISAMVPDRETSRKIQIACDEAYASIAADDSEEDINRKLNGARDSMGKLAIESTKDDNSLRRTVESGTKGSQINIMQVVAAVGQQNCKGKRIAPYISGRTLPCFSADDRGGRARGFVRSPYIKGLTPDEFFFHAIGGREGLCDTAVKTSQTGYVQRRLSKAMESLVVAHDGTIRDNKKRVVQFKYGDDGFDATSLELDGGDSPVQIPMKRILERFADGKGRRRHKAPVFENPCIDKYVKESVKNAPKMSNRAFELACGEARKRLEKGKVEPGESVGVVAAQSIGEPVTQLTLNTFHSAGNSASNVTLGVPRFEELINASVSAKVRRNFFTTKTKDEAFALMNTIRETRVKHVVTVAIVEESHEKKRHDLYRLLPDEPLYTRRKNMWMVTVYISRKNLVQRSVPLVRIIESAVAFSKVDVEVHWDSPKLDDPMLCIYFKDPFLKKIKIRQWLNSWLDHMVCGIKGIKEAFLTKTGFETTGSNLKETLLIDKTVSSDDIWDVLDTLGVEAAREVLFREITRVLKANGAYVAACHIKLLADWMTLEGSIRGTTRHGQKSSGIVARASYEQPVEVFQQAAIHDKKDDLSGVSEKLMFGLRAEIGGEITEMVSQVDTKKKQSERGWNGNFHFTKKRKRYVEPPTAPFRAKEIFRSRQSPQPPPVHGLFGNFGASRPAQLPQQQTGQNGSHPWMVAQSW